VCDSPSRDNGRGGGGAAARLGGWEEDLAAIPFLPAFPRRRGGLLRLDREHDATQTATAVLVLCSLLLSFLPSLSFLF
jgi:hypothetical protein